MNLCRPPTIMTHAFDSLRGKRRPRDAAGARRGCGRCRRKHLKEPYEGWIAADPFRDGVRLLITGVHGFQREVGFAMDEQPPVITERVRETLDES